MSAADNKTTCGFCLDKVKDVEMPCELPCSHVSCLVCLKAELASRGEIKCPYCRMPVEASGLSRLKRLAVKSQAPEPPDCKCDFCDKQAVMFCMDCHKKLCDEKLKAHSSYFGTGHCIIDISSYLLAKNKFIKVHCKAHSSEEAMFICLNCYCVFCQKCDWKSCCQAAQSSSSAAHRATTNTHDVQPIESAAKRATESLKSLVKQCCGQYDTLSSCEKEAMVKHERMKGEHEALIKQIDDAVKQQMEKINAQREKMVKQATERYQPKILSAKKRSEDITALMNDVDQLRVSTFQLINNSADVELLKQSKKKDNELLTFIGNTRKITQNSPPDATPILQVSVQTELSFKFCFAPTSLEFWTKRLTGSRCLSVMYVEDGSLRVGCDDGIKVYDSDLDKVSYFSSFWDSCSIVSDIGLHPSDKDSFLVACSRNGLNMISHYKGQCDHEKDITLLESAPLFFSAFGEVIVFCVSGSSELHIFDTTLETASVIQTDRLTSIQGLQFLPDGCLLVSDHKSNQVVKFGEDLSTVIWTCNNLEGPASICVDSSGFIFVCSLTRRKIYVLSPSGIVQSILENPKIPTRCGTISIYKDFLAIACLHEKQVKIFKLIQKVQDL